jgi:hypothetical protein
VKFFNEYRELCEALKLLGIGEDQMINIDAPFPLKDAKTFLGLTMTEEQLQHR